MNRTYLGQDPNDVNWFFQIRTDAQFSRHHKTHHVHFEFGSGTQRWECSLVGGLTTPEGMSDLAKQFVKQARGMFAVVPQIDALENSEAFECLVATYVKKSKMVLVTNGGRPYLYNQPFNFSFKHFESRYVFQPDAAFSNNFGLTFSGRLLQDDPQPGYNENEDEGRPTVLQIFTRVIRKKTVLHAQLSQLSTLQVPNQAPAFKVLFQMEYK